MTTEALSAAEGPPRVVPDRDAVDLAVARQSVMDVVAARLVHAPPADDNPPHGNGSAPPDPDRPRAEDDGQAVELAGRDGDLAVPAAEPTWSEADMAEDEPAGPDAELVGRAAELSRPEAEPGWAGTGVGEAERVGGEVEPVGDELVDAEPAELVDVEPGDGELGEAGEPPGLAGQAAPDVAPGDPVGVVAEALDTEEPAESGDPSRFAASAVLDVLRATGWADAEEARGLRAEADRLRELLDLVVRDHRAREATAAGLETQQHYWLIPLLRAAHGVAFGSLGAKVALRTAVQEVPEHILATAGLRIDYGVEPQESYDQH